MSLAKYFSDQSRREGNSEGEGDNFAAVLSGVILVFMVRKSLFRERISSFPYGSERRIRGGGSRVDIGDISRIVFQHSEKILQIWFRAYYLGC